jgi:hypothetical protein
MLVVRESLHIHFVVELIGHGDDDGAVGFPRCEDLFVKIRKTGMGRFAQRRMRSETLSGERLADRLVIHEFPERGIVQRTDIDLPHNPGPLKVINGGKDEVVRNHPSSHDGNVDGLVAHSPVLSRNYANVGNVFCW